jgi:hypothetical protein
MARARGRSRYCAFLASSTKKPTSPILACSGGMASSAALALRMVVRRDSGVGFRRFSEEVILARAGIDRGGTAYNA